jgi:hypothetical protein
MKKIIQFNFLILLAVITSLLNINCAKTMQVHTLTNKQTNDPKIYVFRPSVMGYAIGINIYENKKIVGRIGAKGYIEWDTSPSEIILQAEGGVSSDRNLDFVKIQAQLGKTYYFKLKSKAVSARFVDLSFDQISEREAKTYLAKLKQPKINIVN